MPYKKILIAVDDSSCSMKAAQEGFELAHQLKAVVGLISVVDRRKEPINADLGMTVEQGGALLRDDANKTIEQLIKMYDGVEDVMRFAPEGIPKTEILRIAKQWQADLIVMGTHGRTGLERLLTGSVAEYVIRHSKIPVMVSSFVQE